MGILSVDLSIGDKSLDIHFTRLNSTMKLNRYKTFNSLFLEENWPETNILIRKSANPYRERPALLVDW